MIHKDRKKPQQTPSPMSRPLIKHPSNIYITSLNNFFLSDLPFHCVICIKPNRLGMGVSFGSRARGPSASEVQAGSTCGQPFCSLPRPSLVYQTLEKKGQKCLCAFLDPPPVIVLFFCPPGLMSEMSLNGHNYEAYLACVLGE